MLRGTKKKRREVPDGVEPKSFDLLGELGEGEGGEKEGGEMERGRAEGEGEGGRGKRRRRREKEAEGEWVDSCFILFPLCCSFPSFSLCIFLFYSFFVIVLY
jgi:hypothetical protein